MAGPRREKCKSCGAEIVWLRNNNTGALAPIDAEPVQFGGNVVIEEREGGGHHYRILKKGEPTQPGTRHQSHFVTCPERKAHRKPKSA